MDNMDVFFFPCKKQILSWASLLHLKMLIPSYSVMEKQILMK